MTYGEQLLDAIEKGTYSLIDLPPRELLMLQLTYHKAKKKDMVIKIAKIAHERRINGYKNDGQFKL